MARISVLLILFLPSCIHGMAINLLDAAQPHLHEPNYCNDSSLLEEGGLQRSPLGQFIGYPCSAEFYHCRWQSDGYRTYKKTCKMGLVFDTVGTQNCNFDFNIKGCGLRSDGGENCQKNEFSCPLSESCVSLAQRCDGSYDCVLEEDEQNCPMCSAGEFPCIVSEQCIAGGGRCNGIAECSDGTDEMNCDGCGSGMFHCLKSSECIPMSQRCDGTPQCTHGEDELLCKVTHERFYVCENRLDQVPIAQVCNGVEDCPDGSDEKYCSQAPKLPPAPQPMAPPYANIESSNVQFPIQTVNEVVDYDRVQQQRYIQEQAAEEAEPEEDEEELEDDQPVSPLMPIARFIPTTTTRKPTTKLYTAAIAIEPLRTTRKPLITVNPMVNRERPMTSSVSEVAVTAPPVAFKKTPQPYVRPLPIPSREKSVASITITTTPRVPTVPTQSTTKLIDESIDQLEEELIAKLGARFNNQNKLSARDILKKLETMLASTSSDPASASVPAPIRIPPASVPSAYNPSVAYPPLRLDNSHNTKTSVNRRHQAIGSLMPRSRVRVTGRPSSRKWRPSLSINPSHRTTPIPHPSEAEIAVQFRQSDASKTTASPPVRALKPQPEGTGTQIGMMHKHVAASKPVPKAPQPPGKDHLEADETYFTYDDEKEHP